MDEELDYSKLKYVLYARKSTDDPQRQVRSIGDQIFECKQLASRLGLNRLVAILLHVSPLPHESVGWPGKVIYC